MIDAIQGVIDLITPWEGVTVWRGQLRKGYDNTYPAVVVTLDTDAHADSGSARRVGLSFRVYGGSASSAAAREIYHELCERLTAASSDTVLRVGQLSGQELPPDPVEGWPAFNLRAVARITER